MDAGIRGWMDGRDLCGGAMVTCVPDMGRHGRHGRGDGRAGYMTRCGAVRILLSMRDTIRCGTDGRRHGSTDRCSYARTHTLTVTLGHGHAQTYRHGH